MRLKKLLSFVCAVALILSILAAMNIMPISAVGKEPIKRTIAIVYDNSGSMYMYENKAWCQALYAIEVFATMMNPGDKLMVYPMNPMGPEGEKPIYNQNNPLIITDDSQKSIIHTLKSDLRNGKNNTPIEPIDSANAGLKKETADEKWLVLLTDGAVFYENGVALGREGETRKTLENRFEKYILDSNILYLGIGIGLDAPQISSEGAHQYAARTASSEKVPAVLTEMCNMIFGRDILPQNHMSGSSIDFDIPLSKLYVFIQGDGIGNVKLIKDGKELKPAQTFEPIYGEAGCISDFREENNFKVDNTLKGYIASYNDLEKGTYTYSYSGKASSTTFYYEVDADLVLTFRDADNKVITSANEVIPGDYTLEYALVDKNGNPLDSDLLGNVDFELQYAINGQEAVERSKSSGKMKVHIDEQTEFVLDVAEVDFLSGYKIRKEGSKIGFLSTPFKGCKKAAKPLEVELSGGAENVDADLVGEVPVFVAAITYGGNRLIGDDLNNVQFTAEISGNCINCDVKQVESGFEIKLIPEEGLTVVPEGEYAITVNALITSETVSDASGSANTILKVNEVKDRLSLELSYSSLIYATINADKAPEIIASIKYNEEKLSPEQFERLVFIAEADGVELISKPIPEKSAYLITLDTDSEIENGKYPIDITATGVVGRDGEMLTAIDGVEVSVQLLPQWLVLLLWFLAILLIVIIIWFWLRIPVLPKKIRITNISVRVAGREMNNLKASVIYPAKGKKRDIKIKGTGDLSDARWSATLIPAKDSYRYLPSRKRKALVVNGSVKASSYVSKIDIGAESFARDKKDNKLFRVSESERNFTFPKGAINYSGIKDINGKPTKYSVTGDIRFE